MIPKIESYGWQCTDCKSCVRCEQSSNEDKMIFCDLCDRGFVFSMFKWSNNIVLKYVAFFFCRYHIFCVGLKKVPSGNYICTECKPNDVTEADTPKSENEIKEEPEIKNENEIKKEENKWDINSTHFYEI